MKQFLMENGCGADQPYTIESPLSGHPRGNVVGFKRGFIYSIILTINNWPLNKGWSLDCNRQLSAPSTIFLQFLNRGWTLQYVTQIYKFLDIRCSGKTEGHTREVADSLFTSKTFKRPL